MQISLAERGTGSEAVLQALERGEDVTCLVRDLGKLKAPRSAGGFTAEAPLASDKLKVPQSAAEGAGVLLVRSQGVFSAESSRDPPTPPQTPKPA